MEILVVLRVAPALIVLVSNGRHVPLLPAYRYARPTGDAYGYYATAREFISAETHLSVLTLASALSIFAAVSAATAMLWRHARRPEAIVVASLGLGIFISIAVRHMQASGAGAVGWPIAWSLPLLPLRVIGPLGYHSAYYLGICVLLVCNAGTVVATALIARRLVPGRSALIAPLMLVLWPFLMRAVDGADPSLGTWLCESGLALYSEPLSTALITFALALLTTRSSLESRACAGTLLGLATAVRISNITLVIVVVVWLLTSHQFRAATLCAAACLGGCTLAAAYWRIGYVALPGGVSPTNLYSMHYILPTWRDSPVFGWKMLLILLSPSILGFIEMRRKHREAWLLAAVVAVTAAFYSPYLFTPLHPRFLFVALPALFVLAAAGGERMTRAYRHAQPHPGSHTTSGTSHT